MELLGIRECELKSEEQEGTRLGKIRGMGLAGSSNGKGLSRECCRTKRRLVQKGQAFWATSRTSAFTLCEVGAMEGFRKKRDLAGLRGCRREASIEAETHGEATVTVQ